MVIAFRTIPPALPDFCHEAVEYDGSSFLICAAITFTGLFASFAIDHTSGPLTILTAA
jgi:hypothetical protein